MFRFVSFKIWYVSHLVSFIEILWQCTIYTRFLCRFACSKIIVVLLGVFFRYYIHKIELYFSLVCTLKCCHFALCRMTMWTLSDMGNLLDKCEEDKKIADDWEITTWMYIMRWGVWVLHMVSCSGCNLVLNGWMLDWIFCFFLPCPGSTKKNLGVVFLSCSPILYEESLFWSIYFYECHLTLCISCIVA